MTPVRLRHCCLTVSSILAKFTVNQSLAPVQGSPAFGPCLAFILCAAKSASRGETKMLNKIFTLASVVTLGILAAGAPRAAGRTSSSEPPKEHVDEAAHLPLGGIPGNEKFYERQ